MESTTNINNFKSEIHNKLKNQNNNINRIAIQPPRMATPQQRINNAAAAARAENEAEEIRRRPLVVLMKAPPSLHELWAEYQDGVDGKKAAKDFTAEERGKSKCTYCRRKIFWELISLHVRAGSNATDVINRVYDCYGRNLSVNAIIDLIKNDRKNGGHPNLRL